MEDYNYTTEAINKYYSGTDEWQVISNNNITPENAETVLENIQGVDVVKSANGKVLSYNFKASENVASDAAEAVNSNVPPNVKSFDIPANTAVDSGGNMTFASGMAQAGNFVFTKVVPAVAAAGVGIELGKLFDKVLYNANPDFWDEKGMSSLNPDEWNNIVSNDTAGGRLFNMVFGLNPDGKTQAYVDENAFAYMASYMQNKGVFDKGDGITGNTEINYNGTNINIKHSPQIKVKRGLPESEFWGKPYPNTLQFGPMSITINVVDGAKYAWTSAWRTTIHSASQKGGGIIHAIISDKPFTYSFGSSGKPKPSETYSASDFSTEYLTSHGLPNISDKYPAYVFTQNVERLANPVNPGSINDNHVFGTDGASCSINNISLTQNDYLNCALFSYLYGNTTYESTINGIGTQQGAKTPDLSGATTVQETLDALKAQYPEVFADAVTQNVVQPDGSTVTYTYVPIAMPELTPEGNPVSSTSTQANPQIDPATATAPLLDIITKLLQKDNPVNPPDTGSGDTPVVVVPTGSASALYSIYNPSQSQLNSFGAWLWSSNFVDQLLKLFNDPMQAIIGLHKVFASPSISGTGNIKVGYLDSGVSSNIVGTQYTTVDCGSVSLSEYFGNVFDYEPYTKVNLYLPFIGIVPLSVGEVMRSTIHVVYHVDVLTGACLAEVKITRDAAGGTLFQYSGNAAVQYPISSGSYMGIISGIMSIAGGVAGTIATGGAAMPVLLGAGASVGRMHTDISHSGSFSGNAGAMGIKKPYLIIDRPQTALAKNFPNYIGYPSNTTVKLSSCHGFTKVKEIHLENVPATNNELSDIEIKLKGGVII